jgi:hypothetical protein
MAGLPTSSLAHADEGKYAQKCDDDVFCMVKEDMADQELSQPPFKAVPAAFTAERT